MESYANKLSDEGTLDGIKEITFHIKPKRLIIVNDSSTKDLKYKFNETEDYSTLRPTETVSFDLSIRNLYLLTTAPVPYRILGLG